ncbi:SPOR domain-containing protein [Vibrio sp. SS-MA-C1-2]|uniref:SPOR domain-containing protein n=1 Tax=Vibrio sp. SS-MA-C1-2 TaxID=2908646 RepID=UPI001F46AB1E|nr:SPOR domain-containing protein [Vibrio sp. SS-MA-C1-2]UJF18775.1 SPOR domain-containing protein [Vibrio sp. SS-MA-C1-2]
MASHFQSRLVGTIILVAIGIIVLPDLFDGKKQTYQEEFNEIPLQPAISQEVMNIDEIKPPLEDHTLPPDPIAVVVKDKKVDDGQFEPVVEKVQNKGLKESAWVIQLGVFSQSSNAVQLMTKLREAGYQSHVYPEKPQPDVLNRVVVGPNVSKDTLTEKLSSLEKLTGLKGQVLRFDPLAP